MSITSPGARDAYYKFWRTRCLSMNSLGYKNMNTVVICTQYHMLFKHPLIDYWKNYNLDKFRRAFEKVQVDKIVPAGRIMGTTVVD